MTFKNFFVKGGRMMFSKRLFIVLALLLILLITIGSGVDFPTRPVQIIVPWSAGGATDVLFRAIASVFPKYANGQPLVVNNIPGGGAVPGIMEFLKGKARWLYSSFLCSSYFN